MTGDSYGYEIKRKQLFIQVIGDWNQDWEFTKKMIDKLYKGELGE